MGVPVKKKAGAALAIGVLSISLAVPTISAVTSNFTTAHASGSTFEGTRGRHLDAAAAAQVDLSAAVAAGEQVIDDARAVEDLPDILIAIERDDYAQITKRRGIVKELLRRAEAGTLDPSGVKVATAVASGVDKAIDAAREQLGLDEDTLLAAAIAEAEAAREAQVAEAPEELVVELDEDIEAPEDADEVADDDVASDDVDSDATDNGDLAEGDADEEEESIIDEPEIVEEPEIVVPELDSAAITQILSAAISNQVKILDEYVTDAVATWQARPEIDPVVAEQTLVELATEAQAEAKALHKYAESTEDYDNGEIPDDALCKFAGYESHLLRCDAAAQFERLNAAFYAEFGKEIKVTDSYRSYDEQVELKKVKPKLAGKPGTSNHGWGRAIDVASNIHWDYTTPEYQWMLENAPKFGWYNPKWAREGGSKEEAWHWEFFGEYRDL